MKFSAALLAALVAAVRAQDANPSACLPIAAGIPSCAVPCLSAAANAVNCGEYDFACQCSSGNSGAIASKAQSCVLSACAVQTALSVQAQASSLCACVATAAPASTSAPATTSAAVASSAAAPSSSASLATDSDSDTGTDTGTDAVAASAATPGYGSGSVASPTVSTLYVPSPTGSVASTGGIVVPAPSIIPFTGGAAVLAASFGGVAAALIGAIAVL